MIPQSILEEVARGVKQIQESNPPDGHTPSYCVVINAGEITEVELMALRLRLPRDVKLYENDGHILFRVEPGTQQCFYLLRARPTKAQMASC